MTTLLSINRLSGCPLCDINDSIEERRYDMNNGCIQRTYRCLSCGWRDMSIITENESFTTKTHPCRYCGHFADDAHVEDCPAEDWLREN